MRKKEANPFRPAKSLEPPYLTKQQISDFYDEFTLLGNQISVKRIMDAMSSQNYSKTDKIVNKFFEEIKRTMLDQEKKVDCLIPFDTYFGKMINFFIQNNVDNQMMIQMLADSQSGEISKQAVKDALEDSLARKISSAELGVIMQQLKKDDFFNDKLKRTKLQDESQI